MLDIKSMAEKFDVILESQTKEDLQEWKRQYEIKLWREEWEKVITDPQYFYDNYCKITKSDISKRKINFDVSYCKDYEEVQDYQTWIFTEMKSGRIFEKDENGNAINQNELLKEFREQRPISIFEKMYNHLPNFLKTK